MENGIIIIKYTWAPTLHKKNFSVQVLLGTNNAQINAKTEKVIIQ